jgi:hypothetical protein
MRVPADVELDHDEIYWIGSSYYYELAFVKGDWAHPAWGLLPARENPPVSKYVFGLGLAAAGHHITSIDNLSYFYLSWLQWEKKPEARATGPDGLKRQQVIDAASPGFRQRILEETRAPLTRPVVRAARNTSLACAAVASLMLFLLGLLVGERLSGLIASQLLLIHPVVISAASHAMSDTVALMFSIAAALAVFGWYQLLSGPNRPSLGRGLTVSVVTGVLLAFACGAKMNSLVVVLLAGVLAAMVVLKKISKRDSGGAINVTLLFVLVGFTGLAVFIAINPAILQDLPGGLAATVTEHSRTEHLHTDHGRTHMVSLSAKLNAVVSLGFLGWIPFGAMTVVVVWSAVKRWHEPSIRFAVCWWCVALICVTLWIPFVWSRYVIPILPPSVWLLGAVASAGVRWTAKWIWNRLQSGEALVSPAG